MSDTDKKTFNSILKDCPHDIRLKPFAWAKWMRDTGYMQGMSGDLLHHYIVDNIAHLANWGGPDTGKIGSGIVVIHGKKYLPDAKGAMVPVDLIKPQHLLRDEVVRKIIGYAKALSEQIGRFKAHTYTDLSELEALLEQEYGLTYGGEKGNKTFTSFDGKFQVRISIHEYIAFGPELSIARGLIDECLNEWAADAGPEIRAIVQRAFNTDNSGQVNIREILKLKQLDIQDDRWIRAMKAIDDAAAVIGSKSYVRCYEREEPDGAWRAITIDLAKA